MLRNLWVPCESKILETIDIYLRWFAWSIHHFSGYVYLSAYAEYGKDSPTNFQPELQDVIWDGVLSIELYQPTGPEWEAFTEAVIDRSQDPLWASSLDQSSNTSSIVTFAGNLNCQFHLISNIIVNCMK